VVVPVDGLLGLLWAPTGALAHKPTAQMAQAAVSFTSVRDA
jgi:hypothetical protein